MEEDIPTSCLGLTKCQQPWLGLAGPHESQSTAQPGTPSSLLPTPLHSRAPNGATRPFLEQMEPVPSQDEKNVPSSARKPSGRGLQETLGHFHFLGAISNQQLLPGKC